MMSSCREIWVELIFVMCPFSSMQLFHPVCNPRIMSSAAFRRDYDFFLRNLLQIKVQVAKTESMRAGKFIDFKLCNEFLISVCQ
jgi:hypothetical protein